MYVCSFMTKTEHRQGAIVAHKSAHANASQRFQHIRLASVASDKNRKSSHRLPSHVALRPLHVLGVKGRKHVVSGHFVLARA